MRKGSGATRGRVGPVYDYGTHFLIETDDRDGKWSVPQNCPDQVVILGVIEIDILSPVIGTSHPKVLLI